MPTALGLVVRSKLCSPRRRCRVSWPSRRWKIPVGSHSPRGFPAFSARHLAALQVHPNFQSPQERPEFRLGRGQLEAARVSESSALVAAGAIDNPWWMGLLGCSWTLARPLSTLHDKCSSEHGQGLSRVSERRQGAGVRPLPNVPCTLKVPPYPTRDQHLHPGVGK